MAATAAYTSTRPRYIVASLPASLDLSGVDTALPPISVLAHVGSVVQQPAGAGPVRLLAAGDHHARAGRRLPAVAERHRRHQPATLRPPGREVPGGVVPVRLDPAREVGGLPLRPGPGPVGAAPRAPPELDGERDAVQRRRDRPTGHGE